MIDLYSVKPLDAVTLAEAVCATGGRVVTVEDHWAEGGIGDAVASSRGEARLDTPLRLVKLAVTTMPGSAKPDECVAAAGIDGDSITDAARELVG